MATQGKEKRKIAASIGDFTEDILTHILLSLPVKSIGLSRCVCKAWQTLLTAPRFLKLYEDRLSHRNPNLFIRTNQNHFSAWEYSRNCHVTSSIFHTLDTNLMDKFQTLHLHALPPITLDSLVVVGSCNGLVCLWNFQYYISILNPATKELVEIPLYIDNWGPSVLGFGFEPVLQEYKLVRIKFNPCQVMVCTLGENLWRPLQVDTSSSISSIITEPVVHLNGVLHWIARGYSSKLPFDYLLVLSFDLRTEMFGELHWPSTHNSGDMNSTIGVWQDRLAIICSHLEKGVDIWTINDSGMPETWIKVFSIVPDLPQSSFFMQPLLFRKNGDIILQTAENTVILHDPVVKQAESPIVCSVSRISGACTYVEALTSVSPLVAGTGHKWNADFIFSKNSRTVLPSSGTDQHSGREHNRERTVTNIGDLTENILRNIFARVTVKSIGICKCVCKSWSSILTNPYFLNLYLDRSSLRNPNLLVTTCNPSMHYVFQTLDTNLLHEFLGLLIIRIPSTYLDSVTFAGSITFAGSCNGLVCLWDYKNYVSILNPSTRELIELEVDLYTERCGWRCPLLGFGFEPVLEEFKVVRIVRKEELGKLPVSKVMIYTLGKTLWRLAKEDGVSSWGLVSHPSISIQNESSVYLNGAVHWVAATYCAKFTLSFDLKSETFRELLWPPNISSDGNNVHSTIGAWEGRLAIFHSYANEGVDIWIMQDYGLTESWTKIFSIPRSPHRYDSLMQPLVFQKNGDILLKIGERNLLLHDPVSKQDTFLTIRGAIASRMSGACNYVEALTSISSVMAGNVVRWSV